MKVTGKLGLGATCAVVILLAIASRDAVVARGIQLGTTPSGPSNFSTPREAKPPVRTDWSEAWQKFLDKRIDIVANAVSGLMVGIVLAATALGSWRLQQAWSRKIALRHRAEDEKHVREAKAATRVESRLRHIAKLEAERERFANRLGSTEDAIELKRAMDEFSGWLGKAQLDNWATNHEFSNLDRHRNRGGPSVGMIARSGVENTIDAELRKKLADDARGIKLPAKDDDLFGWPLSE